MFSSGGIFLMKKITNIKILTLISLLLFLFLLVGCKQPMINQSPIITSIPITTATVDVLYTYDVDATDPDGNTLTYSLTTPAGMTINSSTGLINWIPTSTGDYDVIVEVYDNGSPVLSTTQSFTIHVEEQPGPTNQSPIITSTPSTSAKVNQIYIYDVDATDPDGDTLTYSLITKPTGMTITSTTGLINWTPTATGYYDVTVEVSDNGSPIKSTTQNFTIHVGQAPVNQPPTITSTPITTATVDQAYSYNVNATDPDGDTLTYSLTTNPPGMTIKSWNGLISWTPAATGDYDVTVKASDGDLFDTQSFVITVNPPSVADKPTVITNNVSSIGDTTATANGNITATGGENCTVRGFQYGLSQTPTWDVHSTGSFGTGSYSMGLSGLTLCTEYYVRAYATNSAGTSYGTWKSFTTTGCPPPPTPKLKLTPSSQTVSLGNQATIDVVVENVTDLRGANIILNFDASKLQYSSSDDGNFIPNDTLQVGSIDNTNGSVTLDIAGLGASGYHSGMGTGTIITIEFDTIATANPTNITFGATQLRDKDNNPITHTKGSGCSVTIN